MDELVGIEPGRTQAVETPFGGTAKEIERDKDEDENHPHHEVEDEENEEYDDGDDGEEAQGDEKKYSELDEDEEGESEENENKRKSLRLARRREERQREKEEERKQRTSTLKELQKEGAWRAESIEDSPIEVSKKKERMKVKEEEEEEKEEEDVEFSAGELEDQEMNERAGQKAPKDGKVIIKQKHRDKFGEEDVQMKRWRKHRRHFFILSSAGKPIYTRYGNEEKLVTFMGIVQALVSFVIDDEDNLKMIIAHQHKFVFLVKGPLYLLAISRVNDSESQLREQLNYLYNQILSVLTFSQLTKIFQQHNNYDLRNLLGGADHGLLDRLCEAQELSCGGLLGAVGCVRLPNLLRGTLGAVLQANRAPDLLYAILISHNKLITLLRPRRHSLHPSDLHILFNMVSATSSFKNGESWTPICLPKFNNKGFLHAHVSFIDDETCLMLISTNRDRFFDMSKSRNDIVASLEDSGHLKQLGQAIKNHEFSVREIGIPSLRHFLYKSRSTVQFITPKIEAPYSTKEQQKRLVRLYQFVHHRAHQRSRNIKIHYICGQSEIVLGWVAAGFELYAVFGSLVPKSTAILAVNNLLRWIKKEEESLFILNSPVF